MTPKVRFPTLDEIRSKAYQIYRARGSEQGHDIDDWLQAEYEMMQLPLHRIAQLDADAVAGTNLKLYNLARSVLPVKKPSSKQREPTQTG